MPICPNCDVAYLDGESHNCGDRTGERPSVNWSTLGGAVSGGIVGIVLVAALFAGLGEPWFIIKAVFLGAPFGAALGAVIGARRASQKHRAHSIHP